MNACRQNTFECQVQEALIHIHVKLFLRHSIFISHFNKGAAKTTFECNKSPILANRGK